MVDAKTVTPTYAELNLASLPLDSRKNATPSRRSDSRCIQRKGTGSPSMETKSNESGSMEYRSRSTTGRSSAAFLLPVNTRPAVTAEAKSGTKSRKSKTTGFPSAKSTKFPRTIEKPPVTGPKSIPANGLTTSLKVRKLLIPT